MYCSNGVMMRMHRITCSQSFARDSPSTLALCTCSNNKKTNPARVECVASLAHALPVENRWRNLLFTVATGEHRSTLCGKHATPSKLHRNPETVEPVLNFRMLQPGREKKGGKLKYCEGEKELVPRTFQQKLAEGCNCRGHSKLPSHINSLRPNTQSAQAAALSALQPQTLPATRGHTASA